MNLIFNKQRKLKIHKHGQVLTISFTVYRIKTTTTIDEQTKEETIVTYNLETAKQKLAEVIDNFTAVIERRPIPIESRMEAHGSLAWFLADEKSSKFLQKIYEERLQRKEAKIRNVLSSFLVVLDELDIDINTEVIESLLSLEKIDKRQIEINITIPSCFGKRDIKALLLLDPNGVSFHITAPSCLKNKHKQFFNEDFYLFCPFKHSVVENVVTWHYKTKFNNFLKAGLLHLMHLRKLVFAAIIQEPSNTIHANVASNLLQRLNSGGHITRKDQIYTTQTELLDPYLACKNGERAFGVSFQPTIRRFEPAIALHQFLERHGLISTKTFTPFSSSSWYRLTQLKQSSDDIISNPAPVVEKIKSKAINRNLLTVLKTARDWAQQFGRSFHLKPTYQLSELKSADWKSLRSVSHDLAYSVDSAENNVVTAIEEWLSFLQWMELDFKQQNVTATIEVANNQAKATPVIEKVSAILNKNGVKKIKAVSNNTTLTMVQLHYRTDSGQLTVATLQFSDTTITGSYNVEGVSVASEQFHQPHHYPAFATALGILQHHVNHVNAHDFIPVINFSIALTNSIFSSELDLGHPNFNFKQAAHILANMITSICISAESSPGPIRVNTRLMLDNLFRFLVSHYSHFYQESPDYSDISQQEIANRISSQVNRYLFL